MINPINPQMGLVYSIYIVKFNIKYEFQQLNGKG